MMQVALDLHKGLNVLQKSRWYSSGASSELPPKKSTDVSAT
jgi:hypothetical protein